MSVALTTTVVIFASSSFNSKSQWGQGTVRLW
jgi:hypothetical protein